MAEFWPEILTSASWQRLQELKKEIKNFTVIGGWAVYLWTGIHKSKDIDIIVDLVTLDLLRQKYDLNKNMSLKKYEIKQEKFDIDIYVTYFSEFVMPVEDLIKDFTTNVQGFRVLVPEALLVLKQAAEIQRRGSVKGEKDVIDICTLLAKSGFSIKKYFEILNKYRLERYAAELSRVVNEFDAKNSENISLSFKDFQKWRKGIAKELAMFKLNE